MTENTTKEYAVDPNGKKYEVVPRNLQYEKEIWEICLEILAKPRKKAEKKNVLSIFKKKHKELYDYILGRTPLLADKKYLFQTKIVWTLNGLLSFPLCKKESCRKPLVGKNDSISETMKYKHFCTGMCATSSEEVLEKRRKTNLEHLGTEWPGQSQKVKDKATETYRKNYGTDHYFQSQAFKDTVIPKWIEKYGVDNPSKNKGVVDKIQKTFLENYGCISPNQSPKVQEARRQHCLEKYGVDCWMKSKEAAETSAERKEKEIETKRKNGTLTTSKPEESAFSLLKSAFPNILRQYRSKQYPFYCDFYIPEKDLYIEFNGNWTHGFHPFDEKNEEDINRLDLMTSKNSKYYNKAIYVWTVLDPKKRLTAKQNNLNFIEFWNLEEVKTWLSSQAV